MSRADSLTDGTSSDKSCRGEGGPLRRGAIVLCGGKSTRMGRDKATLPFGDETMLQRVVRLLSQVVPITRIVVVGAVDQELPELPPAVAITRDQHAARGPLEGLAAGLRVLPADVDAAYVTSCDVPLLVPAFVEFLFNQLGESAIAVPYDGNYHHPLAAVYRPSTLATINRLLAANRLRPRFLFDEVPTKEVPVDGLRTVDPELRTLENLNHQTDYGRALKLAGFTK